MKMSNSSKNDENCSLKISVEDLLKDMPSEDVISNNYELLKSLADPTRLKIVYLLKERELCVCEILAALNKSQSTVSHHLNILKKEGILSQRKEGVWIYYKLSNKNIVLYLSKIFEIMEVNYGK